MSFPVLDLKVPVQCCWRSFRTEKIKLQILFLINSLCKFVSPTGINQFNPMAMQNAQMSQAPMGARTPSPMNHPQQINMNAVSTVRYSFICLTVFSVIATPNFWSVIFLYLVPHRLSLLFCPLFFLLNAQ